MRACFATKKSKFFNLSISFHNSRFLQRSEAGAGRMARTNSAPWRCKTPLRASMSMPALLVLYASPAAVRPCGGRAYAYIALYDNINY